MHLFFKITTLEYLAQQRIWGCSQACEEKCPTHLVPLRLALMRSVLALAVEGVYPAGVVAKKNAYLVCRTGDLEGLY